MWGGFTLGLGQPSRPRPGVRDSSEQSWHRAGAGVGKSAGGEPAGRATGDSRESRGERAAEAQRLQRGPCLRPRRHPKCGGRGFQKEVTASLQAPAGPRQGGGARQGRGQAGAGRAGSGVRREDAGWGGLGRGQYTLERPGALGGA